MTNTVGLITYDRSAIKAGIVHFGVGNFHRSHQAMYLDAILRDPDQFQAASEWGICGVGVLAADIRMRDALRGQDFEYTLVERAPDGSARARQIGSIVDYLYAPDELDAVLERLASPETKIVSLTITEGGYNISDTTGEFDILNPGVVADTQANARPATVFGIIVAGLRLRRERGLRPFTVMSCDNIEGNGHVARRSIVSFARMVDAELAAWIDTNVSFPSSMVDRITPVTTDADREWVSEVYGIVDAWPVVSEDFVQWVLEDEFTLGRPRWELAGVQLVVDVRPYELMKLRLLNASHQALAYAGLLSGYKFAHEGATDPTIARFLRAYMDREATPTLEPVPGIDLEAYKSQLIARFSNPYIRDTLARLATDSSDRIPKFLVPVARERVSKGAEAPLAASVVAAWARSVELATAGDPIPFQDRQAPAVVLAVEKMADYPRAFLENGDWFGDLSHYDAFVNEFSEALVAFREESDPRGFIEELLR